MILKRKFRLCSYAGKFVKLDADLDLDVDPLPALIDGVAWDLKGSYETNPPYLVASS